MIQPLTLDEANTKFDISLTREEFNVNYAIAEMLGRHFAVRIRIAKNGCWLWQLYCDEDNYAHVSYHGKPRVASRVFFELNVEPIKEGYQVDHKCRHRNCVNYLDCLRQLTPKENVLISEAITAKFASQTECKRHHPYTEGSCYTSRGRRDCIECFKVRYRENKMRRF